MKKYLQKFIFASSTLSTRAHNRVSDSATHSKMYFATRQSCWLVPRLSSRLSKWLVCRVDEGLNPWLRTTLIRRLTKDDGVILTNIVVVLKRYLIYRVIQ